MGYCFVMVPEGALKHLFKYFSKHTNLSWCGNNYPLFGTGNMYECRNSFYFNKDEALYVIQIYTSGSILYVESEDLINRRNVLQFNEMFSWQTYKRIGVEWHEGVV